MCQDPPHRPQTAPPIPRRRIRTAAGADAAARDRPLRTARAAVLVIAAHRCRRGHRPAGGRSLVRLRTVRRRPVLSFWGAVFTLGLLLAFSAWLYAVAVFLFRGYRWTRAAALVAQLFVLTIGFPSISGGVVIPGLLMVIPAIIATLLLFSSKVIGFATRTGNPAPTL